MVPQEENAWGEPVRTVISVGGPGSTRAPVAVLLIVYHTMSTFAQRKGLQELGVSIGGLSSPMRLLSSSPSSQTGYLLLLARTSKETALLGLCRQGTILPLLTRGGQNNRVLSAQHPGRGQ